MEDKNVSLNNKPVVLSKDEKMIAKFSQTLAFDLIDKYNFNKEEMGVVARDLIARYNKAMTENEDDIVDENGNTIPISLYYSIILRYVNNLETALEGMLETLAKYQEPETIKEIVEFNNIILGGN